MSDQRASRVFRPKTDAERRLAANRPPVAALPGGGGVVESQSVRFALHPPIDREIDCQVDRLVVVTPFSSAKCMVSIGNAPVESVRIRAGSVIVIPPGVRIRARQLEPAEFLVLSVDAGHFAQIADKAAQGRIWALKVVDNLLDPAVTAIAREIRRALLADPLVEAGYLELLADAILARITCGLITEHGAAPGPEMLAPGVLARIVRHIDDHLGEPLKVDDLALVAGFSRSHFSRAFRRTTGDGPQRFVLKRRICRARDLISETSQSLTEIAAATGFSSQAHMTKAFRDELGVTPSRYREAFSRSTDLSAGDTEAG